jgi:hypothetical protein
MRISAIGVLLPVISQPDPWGFGLCGVFHYLVKQAGKTEFTSEILP